MPEIEDNDNVLVLMLNARPSIW